MIAIRHSKRSGFLGFPNLQQRRHANIRLVTVTAVALSFLPWLSAPPALADGVISAMISGQDAKVLKEFDTRRVAAITAAKEASDEAAVATLNQVLSGKVLPFDAGYDPSGSWRCRFVKVGGQPSLAIYDWFSCRIYDDGAGWVIRKATGSQRTMGRLYRLTEDRLLYLGALHYGYEKPLWFGHDLSRNQIAVLTRVEGKRLRLEFPKPIAESEFDILEFAP